MKLHRYRTLLCAACCCLLALAAAGPGSALGAPITISNITDLQKIGNDAAFPLDGDYLLGGDIDASATATWNAGAGFDPIGDSGTPFTGSFDGKGYTISDLTINRPAEDYVGLFGYASAATLKDVNFDSAAIQGRSETGILAGETDYSFISGCKAAGTVTGTAGSSNYVGGLIGYTYFGSITSCSSAAVVSGYYYIGGLVGYNYLASFTNCSATGDVTSSDYYAGGLIGYNDYGPVSTCFATGDVSVDADNGYYAGGLVGYSEYNFIDACYATGAVSGYAYIGGLVGDSYAVDVTDSYATGAVSGDPADSYYLGGLVGANDYGSFKNCSAAGDVTGYYEVGGLMGYNDYGPISNCSATGAISGGYEYIGGLIGYQYYASIDSSYATGDVSGDLADSYYLGGLIGYNEYSPVSNSYATGAVTAYYDVGGLVGYNYAGPLTNCYATGAVSATDSYVGGLVGDNEYSPIWQCSATGAVNGHEDYIGGLVGYNYYATLTDCYATGAATGIDNATDTSEYVGGLVGYHYGTISTSYSTGAVTGNDNGTLYYIGGLLGDNDGGFVSACFWDTQTSGRNDSDGGEGKTTAEMMAKATFTDAGWDFTAVWDITEGQTYPVFKPDNKPPVGATDNYTTRKNTTLIVTAENGVLQNDSDPDNDAMLAEIQGQPANGTVALAADGSFVYIPGKRFRGDDTFTYRAFDGSLYSDPVTVTITVGRKLCPAAKLYGDSSGQVRLLRAFRDRVLAKTAIGSLAIDMYYKLAPMVDTLLENSPWLGRKTRQFVNMLLPAIQGYMKR